MIALKTSLGACFVLFAALLYPHPAKSAEMIGSVREEIVNAKKSIFIAGTQFTDSELVKELGRLKRSGVVVFIVTQEDTDGPGQKVAETIFSQGLLLRLHEEMPLVNFAVIDQTSVVIGDNIFTNSNVAGTVMNDKKDIKTYLNQWRSIWDDAEPYAYGENTEEDSWIISN